MEGNGEVTKIGILLFIHFNVMMMRMSMMVKQNHQTFYGKTSQSLALDRITKSKANYILCIRSKKNKLKVL